MKSINFINPVPPKKQRELTYWVYSSCGVFVIWFCILAIVHHQTSFHYRMIKREAQELLETTDQQKNLAHKKEQLCKTKSALDQQLKTLTHQRQIATAPFQLLADLSRIIPATCCLTSLQAHISGHFMVTGLARNAKAVATFIDLLNSCVHLDDPRLITLAPNPLKESAFSIAGTWKLTEHGKESTILN